MLTAATYNSWIFHMVYISFGRFSACFIARTVLPSSLFFHWPLCASPNTVWNRASRGVATKTSLPCSELECFFTACWFDLTAGAFLVARIHARTSRARALVLRSAASRLTRVPGSTHSAFLASTGDYTERQTILFFIISAPPMNRVLWLFWMPSKTHDLFFVEGVFSFSQILNFDTMQKEDFPSHQTCGTCIEYQM